jgi:Uma2 family endonuclease
MSAVIEPQSSFVSDPGVRRRGVTRGLFHMIYESGFFGTGRVELINGEMIEQLPKNQPHTIANDSLYDLLTDTFGRGFVRHSAPIIISEETEPEPDLAVTRQPQRSYVNIGNPPATEAVLVVEISDSTLRYDLSTKALVYSRAGIPEYWVLDITGRVLIVHRTPTLDGYADVTRHVDTESISPLAAAQAALSIADFLP